MSRHLLVLSGDPGIPWLGPSGASVHLRGVTHGFQSLGLAPKVACLRQSDHRPSVAQAPDVATLHSPPPKRPHQLRETFEQWWARRLVRNAHRIWGPPSLIYERYSLFCDAGMRLQRKLGVPRILEVNAPLLQERSSVRARKRAEQLQATVLRSADRVVVVSQWLKKWAIHDVGCEPSRVRVVPNGVSSPGNERTSDLRQQLGNPKLLVGFLGSMRSWHGLEAIPGILDALPEAHAVLIGAGPEQVDHPRAHPLGFVDPTRLSPILHAMDVGIAPYSTEAPPWLCPLKLLEYRAHGLPIVTTDVAECGQLVSSDDTILSSQDPTLWAKAIREQAGRKPKASLRTWAQVCSEAIEGMLPLATSSASKG